jgi:hypothetical protein
MSYLCDTSAMPIFEGKRLEFVGVKFNKPEKDELEKIAVDEDRALSYVVRELALRGFVQYLQDGNIKATREEIDLALDLLAKGSESSNIKPLGGAKMIPVERINGKGEEKTKRKKTG